MKHTYFLLSLFLLFPFFSNAQSVSPDVIGSAGDVYANGSGQIQWTLGEVMTETFLSPSNMLTQGFHQPFDLSSGISEPGRDNIADVYPNPATDAVTIHFNTLKGKLNLSLLDVTGKVLQSQDVTAGAFNTQELSVKEYADGMYFLRISCTESNYNQTIRVIKAN